MTMRPIYKECPKCHRKYSWNPDVGLNIMGCPYCALPSWKRKLLKLIPDPNKDKF